VISTPGRLKPRSILPEKTQKPTFHDLVLSFRQDVHSRELEKLLANIDKQQFAELKGIIHFTQARCLRLTSQKEDSAELILPVVVSWLKGTCYNNTLLYLTRTEPSAIDLALVFLWEFSKGFPQLFAKRQHKQLIQDCVEGTISAGICADGQNPLVMYRIPEGDLQAISAQELRVLIEFLMDNLDKLLVKTWK